MSNLGSVMNLFEGCFAKVIRKLYALMLEFFQVISGVVALYFLFGQIVSRVGIIENPLVNTFVLYSSIAIFILYLFFWIWIKIIKQLKYNFSRPLVEIKMLKISEEQWEVFKKFELVAQRNDVFRYVDRYWWSGSGEVVPSTPTPGVTVNKTCKIRHIDYVDYCFNRHLHAGEKVALDIKMIGYDEKHTMQTYVGTTIKEPTDRLLLSVVLPEGDRPEHAGYVVFKDGASGDKAVSKGSVPFHGNKATIEFPGKICRMQPCLGYYYKLYWQKNG